MTKYIGRPIGYGTYKKFAEKYNINISNKNRLKTMNELSRLIYNYETRNNIKNGLYYYS